MNELRYGTQKVQAGYPGEQVTVEYVKSRRMVFLDHEWDSGCVGYRSEAIPLGDFLRGLGVTLKDCEKVLA